MMATNILSVQIPDTIIPFYIANLLLYLGLRYIAPTSPWRIANVALIAACCLVAVRSTWANSIPGGVANEYIVGFILHSSNFLCLAKLRPADADSATEKRSWALNQLISARWATTLHPAFRNDKPDYVPARFELFKQRLRDAVLTGSIGWFFHRYPLNTNKHDFIDVPNDFVLRLNEVTQEEAIIRVYTTFSGYVMQYTMLRFFHSVATCIAMIIGQDPKLWPPIFGDISDAYTVRRWFAVFWHRLMRKAFTSHAVAFCTGVLRLPKKGPVTRLLIVLTTFFISGIMHIVAIPRYMRCSTWPQLRYWCSIAVAIALEDLIFFLYRRIRNKFFARAPNATSSPPPPPPTTTTTKATTATEKKLPPSSSGPGDARREFQAYPVRKAEEKPHVLLRALGFVWVFFFHLWIGTMVIYGMWSRCASR